MRVSEVHHASRWLRPIPSILPSLGSPSRPKHTSWVPHASCRHADLAQLVNREGPGGTGQPGSAALPSAAVGPGTAGSTASRPGGASSSSSLGTVTASTAGAGSSGAISGSGGSSIKEVCKMVYASPTRVHLSLDSSRGPSHDPAPCYPDVAFAVEDFDHAFSSLVRCSDPDPQALIPHIAKASGH
jgi:hypothetical protein